MTDDPPPPVLRTINVEFGVEAEWLVIRVGNRVDRVVRVADPGRSALVMDELERWIVYRVANAAFELDDRLRAPPFREPARRLGPVTAPSTPAEIR